jgi:hypothetical protein
MTGTSRWTGSTTRTSGGGGAEAGGGAEHAETAADRTANSRRIEFRIITKTSLAEERAAGKRHSLNAEPTF